MLVNRGGDPERDDYGLPPVDIEIPDDARELERDIQAYRRELRLQRRRRLAQRLGGPLTRDGMVLPLLASCLALTLLAGTLLTMFTARRAVPTTLQTTSAPRRTSPPVGQVYGLLPAASVIVGRRQSPLRALHPAVLALVPADCRCAAAARQLSTQATAAGVTLYFVATGPAVIRARSLARQSQLRGDRVVTDPRDALGATYQPFGLTAVLVGKDGSIREIQQNLGPALQLQDSLRALTGASPQGLDDPGGTVVLAGQAGLRAA
jgi:hypothetical protein